MRVFVTGGSGFVGRNLITTLVQQGVEVQALVKWETEIDILKSCGAVPIFGDINDFEVLKSGMEGCTVVFHAAAKVDDWGVLEEFQKVNIDGTQQVIAAARETGVSRLVYVSSEAVLIGGKAIINADETRLRPVKPLGPYPLTKAIAETKVIEANSPELTTVVVRPRFVWGKGDTTLLPRFVKAMRNGEFAWISGGRYLTSTCHVKNLCEGLICVAERGKGGEIYFITDGSPVEFRSFITEYARTQGVEPGTLSIPRWLAWTLAWSLERAWELLKLKGSPSITRTALSMIGSQVTVDDSKARRELGYTPVISRQEGLLEMV
ncbi:MAG: NAD-dependent epimerase/dehydratase family protein [Brasilonema octagenarum HA4186-MV1]|jgi:nucleoside-diphosphate-sugar epimerase|uniref:NAD-dependent epimerase n=1 Tax=Brasilonema sennae CENA114 TaxID=415709 RepID=A0A856M9X4_9CYAN|nr:NAD-dependent epimerase/dehydratase family protein [Brasilonema sennae]MBW4627479.1 NAD-dependent epimerase/dehydratase family protein [Brasilonema octagenarum HA4186-MV1]QDL08005.1 NAD-dependent epimerase [Brasilonema sennae CENA114]QDL14365.1 NAD-dependent epimerase [Brasilonema octagenarum UFV-E1]